MGLPITADLLKGILEALLTIIQNFNLQLLIQAVFLIAFSASMLLGELVLRIPNNHTSVLQREDVSFISSNGNSGVQLILRDYKHNREKSPVIIFLSRNPGSKLCPVNALVQYLFLRVQNTGFLLVSISKNVGKK